MAGALTKGVQEKHGLTTQTTKSTKGSIQEVAFVSFVLFLVNNPR
jgi:hypothetical protein